MNVQFDHAGIGRHLEHSNSRIERRRVAFEHHRHVEVRGRVLDRRDQIQIVRQILQRRHENEQLPFPRLQAQCGPRNPRHGLVLLRRLRALQCGLPQIGHRRRRSEKIRPPRRLHRQHIARRKRIGIGGILGIFRLGPRQRIQRQAVTDRRIAGNEKYLFGPQKPGLASPARRALRRNNAAQRKHVADQLAQSLLENCARRGCARPDPSISDRADRRSPAAAALSTR